MKNLFVSTILLTVFLHADLSIKEIESMVYKIHKKRDGVKLEMLESIHEPFVGLQKNNNNLNSLASEEKIKLVLHAVVNGKAYINDSWVKVGDSVSAYTLKYVGSRGVVLRNENRIRKLFLRKNKDSFIKLKEK